MNNSRLKYMMNNDPKYTISQKGSNIRKKIRPFFRTILKLGNKLKLEIEKNEAKNISGPVIYVACHGFKDDVLNTLLTVKGDAYIVFGNIDLFFNTFDGLCLWIYGTQLVDRYDKESKRAMKNKMDKIIEYGNNVIIFSEATWNLSPNKPMENLHWGFYDTALKNNALVVPVLTHKVGKNCYARVLKPMDMKEVKIEDCKNIVYLMKKYINKVLNINIYNESIFLQINKEALNIQESINAIKFEDLNNCLEEIKKVQEQSINFINKISDYDISELDSIKKSSFIMIKKNISRISTSTKEVMVSNLRDIMASEKYDLYEKHPDYSYMKDGKNMYEAWDDYIEDTIKATPYFYPEPEKTTLFKDPLIKDKEEVMPWLKQMKLERKK